MDRHYESRPVQGIATGLSESLGLWADTTSSDAFRRSTTVQNVRTSGRSESCDNQCRLSNAHAIERMLATGVHTESPNSDFGNSLRRRWNCPLISSMVTTSLYSLSSVLALIFLSSRSTGPWSST